MRGSMIGDGFGSSSYRRSVELRDSAIGFLLGYLSPTPDSESDGDDPIDMDLDLVDVSGSADTVRLTPPGSVA